MPRETSEKKKRRSITATAAVIGGLAVLLILIPGTIWMAQSAKNDAEQAVRTVSLLYLDELAGRREQVVENNLQGKIRNLYTAVELMEEEDLSDKAHMEAYQKRMKQLYNLEKFAFVDTDGVIYTSQGTQDNIGEYRFDHRSIREPVITIFNLNTPEKKAVIAIPVDKTLQDKHLTACFMEIDMPEMLSGVSMDPSSEGATFCNIYTRDGVALSNTVLGGLAVEDNLLEAMKNAQFEPPYSYGQFLEEFSGGTAGEASFSYNGIQETLSYVPVTGTDWVLTYLIRESVISDRIGRIPGSIISRSILQSLLTVAALLIMFGYIIVQNRKRARLVLEQETAEAAGRVREEEMQQRLALQEKLLEEEKQRTQQDQMITAMASDYRSVYHVDLDADEAICYRSDPLDQNHFAEGQHFPYLQEFRRYAQLYVDPAYRESFLEFIEPDAVRKGLETEKILAYRYLVHRGGQDYYEMIRVAGVRLAEHRPDHIVHAIGLGFTNIDAEMRETLARQQALTEALAAAEEANKAKTTFLSNMSHEIRTPMNAIIGLDSIALHDEETPEKIKGYLTRIGDSAEHLLELINDILDMSRIESGRMTLKNEEFSFTRLLEVINTMFSSQAREKGLQYECRILGETDAYYIGDDMKLRQVLINILGNAVKFTPEGGRVLLQVERTAHFSGKSTLQFTISDTGIGMSPEFLPHLFETFTQENTANTSIYGSSGLGMAITRNILEMMNGTIEVESEKGKGSTFVVTVTLDDAGGGQEKPEPETLPAADRAGLKGRRILLAEDMPVNAQIMGMVLQMRDMETDLAQNGRIALEKFAEHEPGYYDAILMDMRMPEMDGLEATQRIRALPRDDAKTIPIIALTANAFDEDVQRSLQAGLNAHLSKPVQPELLFATLESLIRDG